ncbi:3-deoxy-D-manno-octulosonic acid transferase [Paracoccus aminophilus]|nr:glycosyltransferase N-terminal domain-containing protein [Paracoccus aminophilus]
MTKRAEQPKVTGRGAAVYRALTAVAGAVLRPVALVSGRDFAERMALAGPVASGGIWIHGASVGELTSAQVLIEDLARDFPVLVTANSLTGRALAQSWGLTARLAPLDVPGAVARFLDEARPRLALTIENEIWPNRASALRARGVAQVVIGARMSARSAARWGKRPGLIGPVLAGIDLLSAQDGATEERLLALGLRLEACAPRLNLKLLAPARIKPGAPGPSRAVTLLVASTHEGEEEPILDAYLAARAARPDLRLILAPRHPVRGDAVAALMAARGLRFARRSQGAGLEAEVLLADTLGEMPLWYDAAQICLTGGSFVEKGGHTPWEPAAHRCAVLHGPHVANFAQDYALLDAEGASRAVTAEGLWAVLLDLISNPDEARRMGVSAHDILMREAGDPAPLLHQIRGLVADSLAQRRGNSDI